MLVGISCRVLVRVVLRSVLRLTYHRILRLRHGGVRSSVSWVIYGSSNNYRVVRR